MRTEFLVVLNNIIVACCWESLSAFVCTKQKIMSGGRIREKSL